MKLHFLSGGRVRMRKSMYIRPPTATRPSKRRCRCALLRHGQGNVLFDTGCHPAVAEQSEARWGALVQAS